MSSAVSIDGPLESDVRLMQNSYAVKPCATPTMFPAALHLKNTSPWDLRRHGFGGLPLCSLPLD